jgi:hypothetical protein
MFGNAQGGHRPVFYEAIGLAIGAGLMFLYDPARGRARRARARDQLAHGAHEMEGALEVASRDVRHRVHGLAAELAARVRGEHPSDEVLAERVRAQLGRSASHPHALEVSAQDGVVTLKGPLLRDDHARVRRRVALVRGLRRLDDQLEVHDGPDGVPQLKGPGRHIAIPPQAWSPAMRVGATLLGGVIVLQAAPRRGLGELLIALAAADLLLRGLTNRSPGLLARRARRR